MSSLGIYRLVDKWMVLVCPQESIHFMRIGVLYDSSDVAELGRVEWSKLYTHSKVVQCQEVDVLLYEDRFKE